MKTKLLLAMVLALGMSARAQTPPPQPPPVMPTNHDFDFWIGDWDVSTPDGKRAGTNRIEPVANGRGLLENWQGAAQPNGQSGGNGKSLNAFNPEKKQWQQFWVGSGGAVLELAGGLVDGKMVLASAEHPMRDGRKVIDRITWTPNADGSVRQHWEQSFDRVATWTTAFDGIYRRKK